MKTMKYLLIIFGALFLFGCISDESEQVDIESPTVAVVTKAIEQKDFPLSIRIGGTLRGDRQTAIISKMVGTVIDIPARVGQSVRKGDLLIKLDPMGVQSQYNQAEAVYLNAKKQFNKMDNLYKGGAISEAQRDAAETEYIVALANFEAARQSVEIEAPFDGIVADIMVRLGDEVRSGLPIIEVANVKALRLILDVPSSQINIINKGQQVTVKSIEDENIKMIGKVISVADAANKAKRSFEVECRFTEPVKGFSPGSYVTAQIDIKTINGALTVPNEALLYRSGKAYVYAIIADTAAFIPVRSCT